MTAPHHSQPDTAAYEDTDDAEAVKVLAAVRHCANSWEGGARLVGNVRASDISRACTLAIAALAPVQAAAPTLDPKTIEECALIADRYWAREVATQIRALAQSSTGSAPAPSRQSGGPDAA